MMGQDSEQKKKKKPFGRQKYLNNFVRNSAGEYVYVGKHFRWGGNRKKELLALWIPAALQIVLTILCGCMPKAGMEQRFYVLLPYLAMFTGVFLQTWKLIDLSFAGNEIRDYIYKRTVPVLRVLPWTVMGTCAVTVIAEIIRSTEKGFTQYLWMGLFLAMLCAVFGCAAFMEQKMKRMDLFRAK